MLISLDAIDGQLDDWKSPEKIRTMEGFSSFTGHWLQHFNDGTKLPKKNCDATAHRKRKQWKGNDVMNKGPNTKSVEKVLGVNLTDY